METGAENENWYRGMASGAQGMAALREALQSAGLEEMTSAMGSLSKPNSSQWQTLPVPIDALARSFGYLGPLGWWLLRPELAQSNTNAVTSRLYLCPEAVAKALAVVDAGAHSRVFEWRAVIGPAAIGRKRKRKAGDVVQLQIQGNRHDPCADQPPHFREHLLRQEQLRSLWWMQQRELSSAPFAATARRIRVDPACPERPIPEESIRSAEFKTLGWQLELRQRVFYDVRGGILGDAPGYGKTATTIGLIDSSRAEPLPEPPPDRRPYFFHSSATLVLVPSNLLEQWLGEMRKFIAEEMPLKVHAIRSATNLKALSIQDICRADIVLCSYRLLYSPVYRRRLLELVGEDVAAKSEAEILRSHAEIQTLRRNTRRFQEHGDVDGWSKGEASGLSAQLHFPVLEQVWWRRVVLDEFHELEAKKDTNQFESLQHICAHYRWGLTGTPPTRDLSQVATLAKIFQIGLPGEGACPYSGELAAEMSQHFLDHFARQNTSEEIQEIPLEEHIMAIDQSPEERAIYLQASRDVTEAEADGERAEQLIKLCSHFAAYCGTISGGDAGSECHRILSAKQDQSKKASKEVLLRAAQLELLWRQDRIDRIDRRQEERQAVLLRLGANLKELQSVALCGAPSPADLSLDSEGEAKQSWESVPLSAEADTAHAAQLRSSQIESETQAASAQLSVDGAQQQAPPEKHELPPKAASATLSAPAAAAAIAFAEVASMPTVLLHKLGGKLPDDSAQQALQDRVVAAAEAAASTQRSLQFFERTLAAARGEASAEERSCSICLEEDLQEEELSITVCAHVFHSSCLQEVVKHFGTCPVCRHKLTGKNKITALAAELAHKERGRRGAAKPKPELATKEGTKLAALAAHLQDISRSEKVLVFCQWEDLKRRISDALGSSGVPHVQLSGNVWQRADTLRRFQEDGEDSRVLLLSLEHSASGTNLTAANHVVFVHPMFASSFDRAVAYEKQALARCRRYGQQKTVHCWRFVARGTIEETITATHRKDLWQSTKGRRAGGA
ncbi:unnamed protein product [Effrenium voratum]|nr:unnamed protein product [Effrenium voratum]